MWSLVDQKVFREEHVNRAIDLEKIVEWCDQTDLLSRGRLSSWNAISCKEHEINRFRVIEAYLKVDLDGSGITSDVIAWISRNFSVKVLRATYLRRVSPTGMLPYFVIQFHLRHGKNMELGS